MALSDWLKTRLAEARAKAEARAAAAQAGEEAPSLDPAELAKGCPGVGVEAGFSGVTYSLRLGSWFGWFWLIFTLVHCFFMFKGLAAGKVKVNGELVAHPSVWVFLGLGLFYIPFYLVGFAFTIARYRVTLTDDEVRVRWRIIPYVGWTWKLAAGQQVAVRLAFRGSESNKKPVRSIVVLSQGREINFGAFIDEKKKAYLAAAIRDYYNGDSSAAGARADFIA
jgi:hypothetical protein